jgi:phosphoribosylaminoimidazolecarboxamide formyltransferase / IMP cyclohydrolase
MPRALLSVWDKNGLIELAIGLADAGWELVASGGTAAAIRQAGLDVLPVEQLTGEPEMLDGRVKTLHPAVHAALLARDRVSDFAELAERDWKPIDLVVVNLYPFEQAICDPGTSLDDALEMIDIGGVALLRAAAKNFPRVTVLCDPDDYPDVLNEMHSPEYRRRMAHKAFTRTADYDAAIRMYLMHPDGGPPLRIEAFPVLDLRYGENPHQTARLYGPALDSNPMGGTLLQGKPLSYNNLLDLDGAWRAVLAYQKPAVVVVKHASPCGIASTKQDSALAARQAIECDPVSAFGSVIACNRVVDGAFINALGDLFVECLAAPSFSEEAIEVLSRKKNLRALQLPMADPAHWDEIRGIFGGMLVQQRDAGDNNGMEGWRVVSSRQPSDGEFRTLRFAWNAVVPVKSNAIVLAQSGPDSWYTVGIGGGQPNRVDCVRIAGERAGQRAAGSVMASDAFFPFPDGIEAAHALGVTAVVQPGGSKRDEEVIQTADAAGMAMIFTGVRHFRH